jgi:RimJ/RimL family protein N-acetyltransferase
MARIDPCLGHFGHAVVPWKRRRGYASATLGALQAIARDEGLAHVDLVTDVENTESQRVITANGGAVVGAFQAPSAHGGFDALLFRVDLTCNVPTATLTSNHGATSVRGETHGSTRGAR